jgi:hypothetical protein
VRLDAHDLSAKQRFTREFGGILPDDVALRARWREPASHRRQRISTPGILKVRRRVLPVSGEERFASAAWRKSTRQGFSWRLFAFKVKSRRLLAVAAVPASTYTNHPSGRKSFAKGPRIFSAAAHALSSEIQHARPFQYIPGCASHSYTLRQFIFMPVVQGNLCIATGRQESHDFLAGAGPQVRQFAGGRDGEKTSVAESQCTRAVQFARHSLRNDASLG